jgi:hypothetical protein
MVMNTAELSIYQLYQLSFGCYMYTQGIRTKFTTYSEDNYANNFENEGVEFFDMSFRMASNIDYVTLLEIRRNKTIIMNDKGVTIHHFDFFFLYTSIISNISITSPPKLFLQLNLMKHDF